MNADYGSYLLKIIMRISMKAKVILISHPKGGVGKSTVSMVLSAALAKRGFHTLLVDCDPQSSASSWAACAGDDTPFPAAVINLASFGAKIHREIQRQSDKYDFILIDTPPALESVVPQAALIFSDICLTPLPLAPLDLWAFMSFKRMIHISQEINPNLKAVILPNKVERTSLSKAILRQLENIGIPVMSSRLSNRIAFQEAIIAGVSVADLGRNAKPAADEVLALTDEVLALLGDAQ
jgi:chromosome partitioning protein